MSNKFYSAEFKYRVITAYETGDYTLAEIESKFNIRFFTLYDWVDKFKRYGTIRLMDSKTRKSYSKELKEAAVRDYLSGEYSQRAIIKKYEISDTKVHRGWIKKYNSYRELKNSRKRRSNSMTKGRGTTWKERIEIVQDCIGNGKDYRKTSENYHVSYQQVYSWVRKYEAGGWDALKDGRGRLKKEEELTTEEKTKIEMRRIQKENERLRAENAFLKKLEEIERGRKWDK